MPIADPKPIDPAPDPTATNADADAEDRLTVALVAFLGEESLLRPVDPGSMSERRLWRACELCTYLGYRLAAHPDPRSLSDDAIADWGRQGLTRGEGLSDPIDMEPYQPYWVIRNERPVGTVALCVQDPGWGDPNLWVSSLYLFPEARRGGTGTLIMAVLEGVAQHLGFGGIRLDTEWLWQGAVRFYLCQGYWVANWKRGLSLVRYRTDPAYRVRSDPEHMTFELCTGGSKAGHASLAAESDRSTVLISARRRGDTLIWEGPPTDEAAHDSPAGPRASPAATFALWLAASGWPLVRGPAEWERCYRWSDIGMPEGLAYKIGVFEAYARHLGHRIDTPRIPGLVYPDWQDLQ